MANSESGATSMENQHQGSNLANEIRKQLESLKAFSSPEYSICKVPDPLRKLNPKAYTPHFVSIGPFHHDNKTLQTLEKYKESYLKDFINRNGVNLEKLVRIIEDKKEDICHCYAETSPLSIDEEEEIHHCYGRKRRRKKNTLLKSDDFVKMILMDASFIMELLLRNWRTEWSPSDNILFKPWVFNGIKQDFLLIENQIPFFIIEELFDCAFSSASSPRFIELTFDYFSVFNSHNLPPTSKPKIKHFVDLLRTFYFPPSQNIQNTRRAEHMYSETQLSSKGLKFDVNWESKCLRDIVYDEKKKTVKIPRFRLSFYTEACAGNIIALEQCLYPNKEYVTDYFMLLNFLIQSKADVILLGEKGIILNELGNNSATFINRLSASSTCSRMSPEYSDICDQLVEFYQKPLHGWLADLIRDYLGTPWKIAATSSAVLLLILTMIQTVCSTWSLVLQIL